MSRLLNISELSKILDVVDKKTNKPLNHILRYWEKEFKSIKPKIINGRRYYSKKQIDTVKFIKFLLKNQGLTISGAKKIINSNVNKLDDHNSISLKAEHYKNFLKTKSNLLLKKINRIKYNGKKNSS